MFNTFVTFLKNLNQNVRCRPWCKKVLNLSVFLLLILSLSPARAGDSPTREYKVKAVYLYKFILFTTWPEEVFDSSNRRITIGILGNDPFGNAFDDVAGKSIAGRTLVIKRFRELPSMEALEQCQLVFMHALKKQEVARFLKSMEGRPILSVSDMPGFIDWGGMINFVISEGMVRFEINHKAATRERIQLSSKLLRLAERIIEDYPEDDQGRQ